MCGIFSQIQIQRKSVLLFGCIWFICLLHCYGRGPGAHMMDLTHVGGWEATR